MNKDNLRKFIYSYNGGIVNLNSKGDIIVTKVKKVSFSVNIRRCADKYHYPDCKWALKIKSENLVTFKSAKEALAAGYVPCKVCRPPTKDYQKGEF